MKRVNITEELAYGTALDRFTGNDKPAPAPEKTEAVRQPRAAVSTATNDTMIKICFLRITIIKPTT